MAEDPRALIRTAQAAELARDFAGAAGLLRRAAELCRVQGNAARAEQLERHAARLVPEEAETSSSRTPALEPHPEISPTDQIGPAGSEVHPGSRRVQADRGPELASLALEAWCSFCCLPSTEVGRLVTGPTGAFICAGCVEQARGSLGTDPAAPAPTVVAGDLSGPLYPAHREALAAVDQAIARGARRILVLGASGAGLPRLVEAIAGSGSWSRTAGSTARALLTEEALLSIGNAQALRALGAGSFLLAAEGVLRARRSVTGAAACLLPTTAELAEATGHRLPYALLEGVDTVLPLRSSTEAELLETAPKLLAPARTVSDRLLRELVAAAREAAHPILELEALIRRLPPGHSDLAEEET